MRDRRAEFRALYRELRIADQCEFYEKRSSEYATADRHAIIIRNLLLFLSALIGVAGQFGTGTWRAACGVVAAMVAASAGAVTAFEALIGFAQLGKLYEDAALNLRAAAIDWDANTSPSGMQEEIERIEQILRTENGQWGQLVLQKEDSLPARADPLDHSDS